jgi:2-methylcitrate dehydratase PrpD
MDCALKLRQKYSVVAGAISEVVCRTAEGPVPRLWEPLDEKRRPSTSYGAKFSLPYSIAVMLIRGRAGLEEFSDETIRDAEILELAGKVRYELDPSIDYPRHFSGHVKIILKDGSVLEENQPHPRGGFEAPLPPEELVNKFRANAQLALPQEKVDKIIGVVNSLDELQSITSLTDLLGPEKTGRSRAR